MTNRLANATSPYLLQHAENPVDWFQWGDEPLARAKEEDKPIFLSIGYAACHWCHVMAHESFENPQTAAIMNENFINIKVDREERPDLDSIYMEAVVAMTGQGGWPMSIFMTPDGKPFLGGTYFPPVRRYNMPAFPNLLLYISNAWKQDRQTLLDQATEVIRHIQPTSNFGPPAQTLDLKYLDQAAMALAQSYDWKNGGWGRAPKFPQPMSIEFFLRKLSRGDQLAGDIVKHALTSMSAGGMYDIIGGGFARYSTDNEWLVPHFEKMLYDNAQLALCYLHAYLLTRNEDFLHTCRETLDFVLRELTHPKGGFYSSLDADSEGEEGKYYVWSKDEIQNAVHDTVIYQVLEARYGLEKPPNFEGKWVLQRQQPVADIADQHGFPKEKVKNLLAEGHQRMLQKRGERVRPRTDDKVLASWNGLMMTALAEAGRYLSDEKYLQAAIKNAEFIRQNLISGETLFRSWRAEQANQPAYLEDYASLCLGFLAVYQATGNPQYYLTCEKLAQHMKTHFGDPLGGFFDTSDEHEELIVRPKSLQDNAVPSGNSMAAMAYLELAAFSGSGEYRDLAEQTLQIVINAAAKYPTAFAFWLSAMDIATGPIHEVALVFPNTGEKQGFLEVLNLTYRPRVILAQTSFPPKKGYPALLENRNLINGEATAYVCQGFVCQKPTNDPAEFARQLDATG
jgi:uncharacterized protein YyaL (SSP411 family)